LPELPEVETIKSQVQEILPLKITSVEYSAVSDSIVKTKDFDPTGLTLKNIERQGKVLRLYFSDDCRAISGLGMSGSWRISKTYITEKHTHVQFIGKSNGKKFYLGYIDPRRFGNIHFFSKENEKSWLKRLGPDVGSKDFNADYLWELRSTRPTKVLKSFMLDQGYFAGMGNYMASEVCARAFIRPTRKMAKLTRKDCENLIKATRSVLEDSIANNGTTFSGGYLDANGEKGEGVQNLLVFYQKHCGICNETEVKKINLGGRGTYFCPSCQK
jgi:formamidopyrimidine-DNA glycosylase